MNTTYETYRKECQAAGALGHLSRLISDQRPDLDIRLSYIRMDNDAMKEFTDFQRKAFGFLSGDEYVLIRLREKYDGEYHLLYVINVTGNSVLSIAAETMDLLSRKF